MTKARYFWNGTDDCVRTQMGLAVFRVEGVDGNDPDIDGIANMLDAGERASEVRAERDDLLNALRELTASAALYTKDGCKPDESAIADERSINDRVQIARALIARIGDER